LKILGFGAKPEPLDEREIEWVQLAAQHGFSPRPCEYLAIGSRVRIERGPLFGVEGILKRVKNKEFLVISVSMLQRSISVEIERSSVTVAHLGLESRTRMSEKKAMERYLVA
jgi:transcription antitermination factor NusG